MGKGNATGPRTAKGKARSSRNATKHGITSLVPVLPGESKAAWDAHRDAFVKELAPGEQGSIRAFLAERAATIAWRIRRLERYETKRLTAQIEQIEESNLNPRILRKEYPFSDEQKLYDAEFRQNGLQRFIDAVDAGETDGLDAKTLIAVEFVLRDTEEQVFPEGIPGNLLPESLSEQWNTPPDDESWDDQKPYSADQLLAIVNVITSMDILRQKLLVFRHIVTECKAEFAKQEREIRRKKEQSTFHHCMAQNVARYETHLSRQLMGTLKALGWSTETPP